MFQPAVISTLGNDLVISLSDIRDPDDPENSLEYLQHHVALSLDGATPFNIAALDASDVTFTSAEAGEPALLTISGLDLSQNMSVL